MGPRSVHGGFLFVCLLSQNCTYPQAYLCIYMVSYTLFYVHSHRHMCVCIWSVVLYSVHCGFLFVCLLSRHCTQSQAYLCIYMVIYTTFCVQGHRHIYIYIYIYIYMVSYTLFCPLWFLICLPHELKLHAIISVLVYIHVCIYVYIYICLYIHMYIYIYMYTYIRSNGI